MLIARIVVGLGPKAFANAEATRSLASGRDYPSDASLPRSLLRRCTVERRQVDGRPVLTLTPTRRRSTWHLLYLHGGAYVGPMLDVHWAMIGELIDAMGARVTVPLYALAPEHDHRPAAAMVDRVYEVLATGDERIALIGDSAGGNFALSLAVRRRDAGMSPPDAVVLFAPWLDLTLRDPRARALEAGDPILSVDPARLCGEWWAGDADPASPHLSPLYADPRGLPPTILFQGDRDILVFDSRTFAERARAAGCDVTYREYPGAFHVFMAATFTPEAHDVWAQTAALLDRVEKSPGHPTNNNPRDEKS